MWSRSAANGLVLVHPLSRSFTAMSSIQCALVVNIVILYDL